MNRVASRANWLSGIFTPEISLTICSILHQYQVKSRTHCLSGRGEAASFSASVAYSSLSNPDLQYEINVSRRSCFVCHHVANDVDSALPYLGCHLGHPPIFNLRSLLVLPRGF